VLNGSYISLILNYRLILMEITENKNLEAMEGFTENVLPIRMFIFHVIIIIVCISTFLLVKFY